MDDATERGGLSVAVRLFLVMALLVAATVASAVWMTRLRGTSIATDIAEANLRRAGVVQNVLTDQRLDQLRLRTQVLTGNAAFAAYLEQSLDTDDSESLIDQLEQAASELESDLVLLLDPDGVLMVSTREGTRLDEDLSADPLVREALEAFEASGVWARGNKLYDAVVAPVATASLLVGFLVAGFEIDEATTAEIRDITGAHATIFARSDRGPRLVATTLEPSQAQALMAQMAQDSWPARRATRREEPVAVTFEGRAWLASLRPLWDVSGVPVGAVVTADSLAAQRAPFDRLNRLLGWIGLGAVLLSLPFSFLIARRILRPVQELAKAARAAADGEYDQRVGSVRRDEIGTLSRAFDTLLSDLRERRDMARYVAELGRSLPAPEASTPTPTTPAPSRRMAVVLTVTLARTKRRTLVVAEADPVALLEHESDDLRRAARAVAAHGGQVEAALGRRLVASFQGDERASRALSTGAALRAAEESRGSRSPAMALSSGLVVTGVVSWDEGRPKPTFAGPAADEADRLLGIAKAGDVVVARSLFGELDVLVRRLGLRLEDQPEFSPALPLYAMPPALLERLAGPAADVTWPGTSSSPTLAIGETGALSPGQVIAGRYEVLRTLGKGGMGVVYQVRDNELDELVAMKMLKPGAALDAEQLERMKQEIKLARKITHQNVLRTFDFGEFRGTPFITMEYVPGITLRQLLDQAGRLPLSAGLRLARQLCRGLEVAHGEGVLHRDIKPENLIVEPNGNAKLMDFGIAISVAGGDGRTTKPGMLVGTPVYLAPEQIQGQEPDERADIYACGAVFYELFTGKLPFSLDGNVMSILQSKLESDPPAPSSHWPEIPDVLERIIQRCLAREPGERFASVEAVLEALAPLRA